MVTTATYSSRGIAAAYEKALAMAEAAYEEQHPSAGGEGSGTGSGAGGSGTGTGAVSGATGSEGGHA